MISAKKPPKSVLENTMVQRDSEIRSLLLNVLPEPKGWVKTDIHLYKNGAGRVNFWHTVPDSANLDIVSYYFTHDMAEIKVFDEFNCIKFIKF